jgi:sterol desaturase/sphingolipid hydroxylase (fatty acid hydroxylase superfamily)
MVPADATPTLDTAVTSLTAVSFLVLLLLEAVVPRTATVSTSDEKLRHAVRNVALWAVGTLFVWALAAGIQGDAGPWQSVAAHGFGLWLPLSAQLVLAVLVIDLSEYLRHRLFHRLPKLWLVHVVHHSDHTVDVTTGLRFHPLETILVDALRIALLVVFGLPIWALAVRALFQAPVSALQHAAIQLPAGFERIAGWLIVTPAMHRVHHSRVKSETDSNYGELFSFWDRLFGTYYPASRASGGAMGVSALTADSWQTVLGMLSTPIRARNIEQF